MSSAVWQERKDSLADSINALRFGTALRHLGGFTRLLKSLFGKTAPGDWSMRRLSHRSHMARTWLS
jgi:hypothetical protein